MKKTLMALVGLGAASIVVAPLSASAAIPDPLPSESIADLAVANDLDTLVTALTAADLAGTFSDCTAGPFTVFAPTDAAFAALSEDLLNGALGDPDGLLTEVLTYHVVPGIQEASVVTAASSFTTLQGSDIAVNGTVLNGSVNIVATDVFGCNGVVHVIDSVLIPELPSIATIATDAGLETLVTAVTAAGLADGLADCSAAPVTVFAPTDDAFAALPADVLSAALADPEGLLTQVLGYHVVPGIVGAAEVTSSSSLTTAQGEAITVDGAVLNGSVNIVTTDVWACNGVVHVIDAVLLPAIVTNPPEPETPATTVPETPVDHLPATGATTNVMLLIGGVLVMAGFGLTRLRRDTV